MSLPVNIDQLINGTVVEWERLDFKEGWNPEDVMHSMCAFANDIHNWGGGYIITGISEEHGRPILPPKGLDINTLDSIQKKLVELSALIQPTVNYIAKPVMFEGKNILVIWVPGGDNRPYKAPTSLGKDALKQGRRYYIRKGSVTCIADNEDERRLIALTNKIPFDDRLCHNATVSDLSKLLMSDYLQSVGSRHTDQEIANMTTEQLAWDMQILGGTTEYTRPKNVGVLFFTKDPEHFLPGSRIEIVRFGKQPSDVFEEKILHGPIHKQLEETLSYIKSQIITEKVQKQTGQAHALRAFNYPYEAIEEIICNAVYHKSWDERTPIEVNIYPDRITIYNIEGPVPPLTNEDMQKEHVISRNYRNRRIGDFLKELHLTEGRNTGFPKIYREIRQNGSPLPIFETDERNLYFMATLPIHPIFLTEEKSETGNTDGNSQLTERQIIVYKRIAKFPNELAIPMAKALGLSRRTLDRETAVLRRLSYIQKAEPGVNSSPWIILKQLKS